MRIRIRDVRSHIVLLVIAALVLYPMCYMLINALNSGVTTATNPWWFGSVMHWQNYRDAFAVVAPAFLRTVTIVVLSVAGTLVCASPAAYAFSRYRFRWRNVLFMVFFALLLIPGFVTLIPLVLEIRGLGLTNTMWGLVFPYIAGGQAFGVFILRTFYQQMSQDLIDAARIDGATDTQIFVAVAVPLAVPVMITVAILQFVGLWSDYVLPSLILSSSNPTVAMAITNFSPPMIAGDAANLSGLNMQFASFVLASIPIGVLFAFLMRYFVQGITSGAVKL